MGAHQAKHRIATMSRVLGVFTSGYTRGARGRCRLERRWTSLLNQIRAIHDRSRGTYGVPRIHAELGACGVRVGRKRIARLMPAARLAGVSRRKGTITLRRDHDASPAPDLVERNFVANAPNRLWVADITYIPTWAGFLYLSVVIDACSRRVVGWAMGTTLKTDLVLDALNMALEQRRPDGVITTPIKAANTPPSPSDFDAARWACGPRWARSAMRMTMRCARASSPHSNASSSIEPASRIKSRRVWRSSTSSRDNTTRTVDAPPSRTLPRSTTRGDESPADSANAQPSTEAGQLQFARAAAF